ncbi:hypothetical protein BDP27DRAFT_1443534 [Rhodocollybia butyracea]|uniref:Aminoglycoside phosphotransferase domain-containing protein n=1 Tax=Rhodocollybia butyracea TaxID=206335 RepID=A0A9P5UDE2_9AGAR|nr:hypothetical protein BDP27DRAFT_1443534 [Rhodocollybia butyracea]
MFDLLDLIRTCILVTFMLSLPVPHELAELERDAIITHLHSLVDHHVREEDIRSFEFSLPGRPSLFIKSGPDVLVEASTQHFFYLLSNGDESAPRIPKVFDAFYSERGYCFLVMEKVAAPTLSDCEISEEEAVEHAAFAVKWLLDQLTSVPDTCFGRISSEEAPALHRFFKQHDAPYVFANPDKLAEYVSKASKRCRMPPPPSAMEELLASIKATRCIYHCDIKKENFLFGSGKVWIIDFQHIGVFPQVFQTYAFFNIGWAFAASVGRKLGYHPSSSANVMVQISSVLQQIAGAARLGLRPFD